VKHLAACLLVLVALAVRGAEDHRAWQHGVDLLWVGPKLLLVWGSAGNPPRPNLGGDWQHDIYYAWLDPATATQAPLQPQLLVSLPEAQEPPSVARNSWGRILVTSEDGNGGINQNAGLWDSSLRALHKYPFLVRRGGHSGHAAALGSRFLVVYGEGWTQGGGFMDRGTGNDILARIVKGNGRQLNEITVASGRRDSWPLVAASGTNWMVVWQRYPAMTLHSSAISITGNTGLQRQVADGMPARYAYDVQYARSIGRYVVAGTSGGKGFMSLLDRAGEVRTTRHGLPPMASESRLILRGSIAVYPISPRGLAVVRLSREAAALEKTIDHPHEWDYTGTAGVFLAPDRLLFATLSRAGLRLIGVDLGR